MNDTKTELKRRLRLEIKDIAADGTFEGLLSPYGNVDDGGDVVEPGAYTKTLKEHGNKVPVLWQHKQDCPIGELTLEDRPEGLWCKGRLLLDDAVPEAAKAYALLKAKIIRGLSIGFTSVKDAIEGGVRHLKEIRLYEGSVVTFPMNELARVMGVKARETKAGDLDDICQTLCRACGTICEEAIYYLYAGGQESWSSAAVDALCDCISACDFCCGATYRQSPSMAEICALCATICSRCAEACAAAADDPVMAACAEICQSCSSACLACAKDPGEADDDNGGGAMGSMSRGKLQLKSGRKVSAATKTRIKAACTSIKSGHDDLLALVSEAVDSDPNDDEEDTSEGKAAKPAPVTPEPGSAHSAAEPLSEAQMLESLRALIPA